MKQVDFSKPRGKLRIFVVGTVLVLLICAATYAVHYRLTNCRWAITKKCMLEKAAPLLDNPEKSNELKGVADKIPRINKYDQDPDLLYILFADAYGRSDVDNAKKYYNKLKTFYRDDVGYDKTIKSKTRTPEALSRELSFLENYLKQNEKLRFGVPLSEQQ